MTDVVDSSCALYAVIEARWSEGPPERFVIAYRDEESLRDVIAAPSIVGTGFITREEALVNAGCWPPVFRGSTQTLMPSIDIAEKHHQRGFSSAKRRLVDVLLCRGGGEDRLPGSTACRCRGYYAFLFEEIRGTSYLRQSALSSELPDSSARQTSWSKNNQHASGRLERFTQHSRRHKRTAAS